MLIHTYWSGPEPGNLRWRHRALTSLNPGVEHRHWTDDTLPSETVAWLDAHADDVRPVDRLRHRANMVRGALLLEHGGWWVDHDVIMLRPFADLPFPMAAEHQRVLCSCVLGFPPDHPVLRAWFERVDAATPDPDGFSTRVSGERLLDGLGGVRRMPLPHLSSGQWTGADPWAVHLYDSKAA